MTELQRKALARLALTVEQVEAVYAEYRPTSPQGERLAIFLAIRMLCESHERLRMELQGAEELLNEKGGA